MARPKPVAKYSKGDLPDAVSHQEQRHQQAQMTPTRAGSVAERARGGREGHAVDVDHHGQVARGQILLFRLQRLQIPLRFRQILARLREFVLRPDPLAANQLQDLALTVAFGHTINFPSNCLALASALATADVPVPPGISRDFMPSAGLSSARLA